MDEQLKKSLSQWNKQEEKRIEKLAIDLAYIELNNEYLAIERGTIKLNVWHSNNLRCLVGRVYGADKDTTMYDYWQREFEKLPGWLNF